jgi:hypothetical protein
MREWLVIEKTAGKGVFASEEQREAKGYIPRDVAEAICGRSMDGLQFFSREESAAMHAHPEWKDSLDGDNGK